MFMWETIIEGEVFFGDLHDQHGRRTLVIIKEGIAVLARCTIENYYVMKDDFDKLMTDFDFILAGKLNNGSPCLTYEAENIFEVTMQEEIAKKLMESLKR